MAMFSARGLNNFISDLRACTSREDEQKRVDKELAKMRQKFSQTTALNSYDKKKYTWKLIYVYMLGYEVDFGHMQVINLVSGTKYSEKCLGYLGCSILLKSSDELMTLVINCIRNDLKSPDAAHQCLALCCVANLGGSEFSEALAPDVVHLLMSSSSVAHVRKKAALCARRMLPPNPELIPVEDLEPRLRTLLSETHLGVVTSAASLLQTALLLHPSEFRSLVEVCVARLTQLVVQRACPRDYMYYNTPAPWLQVKLLRLLQQFGPIENREVQDRLSETLTRVLSKAVPGKGAKFNAAYAVLIETVNLVIALGKRVDAKLTAMAVTLLAKFISVSEPNIRYIGLDSMYRLVRLEGDASCIKDHQRTILFSLKDADNSVRRRALDLLFSICDASNVLEIVGELVTYLALADGAIREEIVLKAAILSEKYATNLRWYVDTVLQLITIAGADVPDDVWHRVVQIVTNKEELQKYTAEVMFRALEPRHVDETTAKFGAYVLGEFGYLIGEAPGTDAATQLEVLARHYAACSVSTQCLMLTAFVKMENLFEELQPRVGELFRKCMRSTNLELQQRACEYMALHHVDSELMKTVLEPMPVFPETRESALIVRLRNQQKGASAEGEEEKAETTGSTRTRARRGEEEEEEEDADGGGDLLSLDSPVKAAPAYGSEAIRGANPVADLVDIFGGGGPSQSPAGDVIGVDASLAPKLREWTRQLLLAPQGVLFENDLLQIGVKHQYRGSQGRVALFFGNKTGDALTQFAVQVDATPASALRWQCEPVGDTIGAKQQSKTQILIESMAPFVAPPTVTVRFQSRGARFAYCVALPCHAAMFLEPVPLRGDEFMQRWQALEGQDREQQEMVPSTGKMDMIQVKKWLTESIKMAQAEGIDTTGTSVTVCGTFRTGTAAPTGDKVSVGCLVRVEANPSANAYRVTVRAVHKDVSMAIKNDLVAILA